mgnify:CR=1 FL=1
MLRSSAVAREKVGGLLASSQLLLALTVTAWRNQMSPTSSTIKYILALVMGLAVMISGCTSLQPNQGVQIKLDEPPTAEKATKRTLKLVVPSWTFKWSCAVFDCQSTFNGYAQLIDASNGTVMTWNTIETWSQDDCGANPGDNRWYKKVSNTTDAPFGFGTKDGKSHHASVYFKFYGNEGVWTASTRSQSCG